MGNSESQPDLMDVAIEMKLNSKMITKQAQKIEQQEAAEKKKVLQYMQKGDMESAKVFAENAIRAKKECLNTRRFGVKMSALASKIESAARTQQMSQTMKQSVPAL